MTQSAKRSNTDISGKLLQVRNNGRLARKFLDDAERLEDTSADVAVAAPTSIAQVSA